MTDVRAITVKQPWAWAIAAGHKLVENRSQGTRYRGELLIHAGKAWSDRGGESEHVRAAWFAQPEWPAASMSLLPTGVILAVVQLVDSHPDAGCCRPWGESSYTEGDGRVRTDVHHLVLEEVHPLSRPLPARGALGLWRPPADLLEAALADVRTVTA